MLKMYLFFFGMGILFFVLVCQSAWWLLPGIAGCALFNSSIPSKIKRKLKTGKTNAAYQQRYGRMMQELKS